MRFIGPMVLMSPILSLSLAGVASARDSGALEWYGLDGNPRDILKNFETPDWVKHAIFYQIFVDRFRDSD